MLCQTKFDNCDIIIKYKIRTIFFNIHYIIHNISDIFDIGEGD